MSDEHNSHLLQLPGQGQLFVCTDLHGHLPDFRRMRNLFIESWDAGENPFLLFSGDLIHGPSAQQQEWPSHLESPYPDESVALVEEFIELQESYPGHVTSLLGNHEHSHIGGPHTPKFWPDETLYFERNAGPLLLKRLKELFHSFPLVAISDCGIVITHAAPNLEIQGPEEITRVQYDVHGELYQDSVEEMSILGPLLWSRSCHPDVARRFLRALSQTGPRLELVVYGHEIVNEGYVRISDEQLLLSTSFGVRQENKTYLRVDLSSRYRSTEHLRQGQELRRLYQMI